MIDGIGKDAEVVTNSNGGKQSKAIGALHLVDPDFLYGFFETRHYLARPVINYMDHTIDKNEMLRELFYEVPDTLDRLLRVSKVLEEGAEKYTPNNWRLIPEEEHINHALCHLIALEYEDQQDDHYSHFLCRMMMAYATEKSPGFDYILPKELVDE